MLVAFGLASAFLLFSGEAVWPALATQITYTCLQYVLMPTVNVYHLRNLLVQLMILYILYNGCGCCQEVKRPKMPEVKEERKELS